MDKQTLKALGLVAQQLAAASTALAQILSGDGDPAPTGRKAAAPAVKMGWSAKQLKMLEAKASELVEDAGLDKKDAAARAVAWMEKRGEKKATPISDAPAATEEPKRRPGRPPRQENAAPAQNKKKIRMITLDDVREGNDNLGEFTSYLADEMGIPRDSEDFASIKAKFLELRRKFRKQVEEEQDVQDANGDLAPEGYIEGDENAVTYENFDDGEEPPPAPKVKVRQASRVQKAVSGFDFNGEDD